MSGVNRRRWVALAFLGAAWIPSHRAESSAPGQVWSASRIDPQPWFIDRGSVHLVDVLGPAEAGRRQVRVWRDDGRAYAATAGADALVQLAPGEDAALLARWGLAGEQLSAGARVWRVWPADGTAQGDARPAGLVIAATLGSPAARAHFTMAVPNLALEHHLATRVPPDDPRYGGQWYLEHAEVADAWAHSTGTSSVTVVVVDTGCDLTHPDLVAKLDPGLDVIDGDEDPSYDPRYQGAEHGTACSGIVGATTDNGLGIAGACPDCRLRCVRLIGGSVPISADVRAFAFAKEVGAAVVSNSWSFSDGTPVPGPLAATMRDVMETGRGGLGTTVVFAAGNENRELEPDEIAAVSGVITVGALTVFDEASAFSNRGAAVALTSPMGTLTTDLVGAAGADPTDYTNDFGGTSSACPLVAGIAGLLASAKPDATAQEIRAALLGTTRPAPYAVPDETGHDPLYGYGIVSAGHAMRSLLGLPEPGPDAGVSPDAAAADAAVGDAAPADAADADAGATSTDASATPSATDDGGCTATHGASRGGWGAALLLGLLLASRARSSRAPRGGVRPSGR